VVFNSDTQRYGSDSAKISYAASHLRGAAKRWFTPQMDKQTGEIKFKTFVSFVEALGNAFDDPDAASTAEQKLRTLKQGTDSCATYHSKFVGHMAILGWDGHSQISWFKHGLREEVKDMLLAHDTPNTIEEFVKLCVKLDNRWRARQQEKKSASFHSTSKTPSSSPPMPKPTSQSPPTLPSTSTGTHPGPMDLSAGRRGKLTDQERAYRKANNLCMYCGNSGHYASQCPYRPQQANGGSSDSPASVSPQNVSVATGSVLYSTGSGN
jgi:hypothetical protein